MTKSGSAQFHPLLGIIFMIAGVLILILAFLNYLQDGKISLSVLMGFFGIFFGALWYSHAKKSKAQDK
jgi:uncharacterized membrane protein HdeD (DUF308 family)